MVLAAGYGRRLRPLTDEIPKALVDVGGLTQLERTLRSLEAAGADRVVVNTHHHADQIETALADRAGSAEILVSPEVPRPLETGGGLLAARPLFRLDRPILVHNVDVITSMDITALLAAHAKTGGLATLAVQERAASRYLLLDAEGLQGRLDVRSGEREEVRPLRGSLRRLAFTGVHVASPRVFARMTERGAFSIIDCYLRLAGEGEVIGDMDVGPAEWWEIGTPERLAAARARYGV
ncbi:MAG: NTP transferase domain-containing protein [Gemmatimonadales bacterium]|jgi:NDP-sugar pyrophosphorylase family protein